MKNFPSQYLGKMQKIPRYSLITYPDGGLISSISDMSKYLIEMIRGYHGESKILTKESFREMMSPQSKVVKLRYAINWRAPARNGLHRPYGRRSGYRYLYVFQSEKQYRHDPLYQLHFGRKGIGPSVWTDLGNTF